MYFSDLPMAWKMGLVVGGLLLLVSFCALQGGSDGGNSGSGYSSNRASSIGTLLACPADWQFMSVYGLISKDDMVAARKAADGFGCKTFFHLTPDDVTLSDSAAGFVCVRPRGEPQCLWTTEGWLRAAHLR